MITLMLKKCQLLLLRVIIMPNFVQTPKYSKDSSGQDHTIHSCILCMCPPIHCIMGFHTPLSKDQPNEIIIKQMLASVQRCSVSRPGVKPPI